MKRDDRKQRLWEGNRVATKALFATKVSLVKNGSHDHGGDKQIEEARVGSTFEKRPPPQNKSKKKYRQGRTKPLMDGHSEDTIVVMRPQQPASRCGKWRDDRRETQCPPTGVTERRLAEYPREDIAADRDWNQRSGEIDQHWVDVVDRNEILKRLQGRTCEYIDRHPSLPVFAQLTSNSTRA